MKTAYITKIINVEKREFQSTRTIDFIFKQLHADFSNVVTNYFIYRIEDLKDEFIGENNPGLQFSNDVKCLINLADIEDAAYFKILN